LHQWWDDPQTLAAKLNEAGFDPGSRVTRHLARLSGELRGFPRHLYY
jgi:error-prone DNA polymerase